MTLQQWVKMPSAWIESGGLKAFRWKASEGANNLAALILYVPLVHFADPENGAGRQTYDSLCEFTSLSRAKVARGFAVLEERQLIERGQRGNRSYQILNHDPQAGWAKLPAKGLYMGSSITAFRHFYLRSPAELDALKLFYLFAARRDNSTNLAHITYEQIEERAGISQANIRRGLSLLTIHGLVHVERRPSSMSAYGVANAYRIPQIDGYKHMGTTGRKHLDW